VRERQAQALRSAHESCNRLIAVPSSAPELRDHELRSVEMALDALVGRISVEEVLGAVFSRFCIGK
jgi:tRNA modification GTPase